MKLTSARIFWDRLGLFLLWGSGLLLPAILLFIVGCLVWKGGRVISWEFLSTLPKGAVLGAAGGILPAIKGTLGLIGLSMAFAAPVALITAVYLAEYGYSSRADRALYAIITGMVGLPSILTGMFGYAVFVVYLGFGLSLLSGSLTLAIMVFPTLVALMRNSILSAADKYRALGLSLGVSRWYLLLRVTLPAAVPGLVSAALLAIGYAAGATAPIMVTAAVIMSRGSIELTQPVMALPYHLYILFSQHISLERAYATALVLLGLLLVCNIAALVIRKMAQRETGSL
ncbi:MAG TPA: ABC transporter permease subunit [Selenomonadales bacterium]|nr:ABC transporter permease subunit [Selenomonadales bacterium]